ncbi:MAG: SDR family NAD(P)-dependent oxidoreductase [Acholeplasmatales bacterium]|jgi:NAD(P)-dependent dehydrogenase (short-subunit alcohol dehydrogenase family)|nr:SDR family NAD(P)-dependent oxidoreductase [Acholeplasmatales bacterium]
MNKNAKVKTPYSWHTKAIQIVKNIDLSGHIIIVTGATNGIGYETTRVLAKTNAIVIAAVRNVELGYKRFKKYNNVHIEYLDLSKDSAIFDFINVVKTKYDHIDALINNAGVMGVPYKLDIKGVETHFLTNHIGPFELTLGLLDLLNKGVNPRIINLASVAHKWSDINYDDIGFVNTKYDYKIAYAQSKTASILFTTKLSEVLKDTKIKSYSVHPGIVPFTNVWNTRILKNFKRSIKVMVFILNILQITFILNMFSFFNRSNIIKHYKTNKQGASTTLWCLTNKELDNYNGAYCEDCNIYPVIEPNIKKAYGVAPYAIDMTSANKLWDLSISLSNPNIIKNEVIR